MPVKGFTPEEEQVCRGLGMFLLEAYARWGVANDPAPEHRKGYRKVLRALRKNELSAAELGDAWVVWARGMRDYFHASEGDLQKLLLGPPAKKETVQ